MKTLTITLDGVEFAIDYKMQSEEGASPGQNLKRGIFVFRVIDQKIRGEDFDEIKDPETFKRWMTAALDQSLIDYLVPDLNAVYKVFKINKLSLDISHFELTLNHLNCNDDQRLELTSYRVVGNTVAGRKDLERAGLVSEDKQVEG